MVIEAKILIACWRVGEMLRELSRGMEIFSSRLRWRSCLSKCLEVYTKMN